MTDHSIHYECDLFEWAERNKPTALPFWAVADFDELSAIFDERPSNLPNPEPYHYVPEPPAGPPPELLAMMETEPDPFLPGVLEFAELMYDRWAPVQEESERKRALTNRVHASRRRKRMRDAEGHFDATDVDEIRDLQDNRCCYCGIPFHDDSEIEHIIPIARGGDNSPDNIALACTSCNRSKGVSLPDEWKERRGW